MSKEDRSANIQKTAYGVFVIFLLVISGINFYRYISLPTDENWFTNPPSRFSVTSVFSDTLISQDANPDEGDLLISINKNRFQNSDEITNYLAAISGDSIINIELLRPVLNEKISVKVHRRFLSDSFFIELPDFVYVFDVTEGGASDRAGMKKGDLIYKINGQSFKNSMEADRILRLGHSGKAITYEIFRGNRPMTLHVILSIIGVSIAGMTIFLCGLIYILIGAFILLKRHRLKAARYLGLGMILMGYYLSIIFNMRDVQADLVSILRDSMTAAGFIFGTASWLHSGYYFPLEITAITKKRWPSITLYSLAGLGMILSFLVYRRIIPVNFNVLLVISMLLLIGFNGYIKFRFRKSRDPRRKKLSRIIKWTGISAGILAVAIIIYANSINQQYNIGYIGIPLVLIPLAYLYTIGRYRLLDLQIRVRKNIQYSVVTFTWIITLIIFSVYILIFFAGLELNLPNIRLSETLIEVLDQPASAEKIMIEERFLFMILAVAFFTGIWRFGRFGQRLINQKYYRSGYDYRNAARQLGEMMQNNLNMEELARGMAQKLSKLMHLKRIGVLFFKNETGCCCQEFQGFDGKDWSDSCIRAEKEIIDALKSYKAPVNVRSLPPMVGEIFFEYQFYNVIPIHSKDKLVGLFLVGEKLSESPFYQDDFEFLSSVAKQASVSIENAFLYSELAEQERMKHELKIARQIQISSLPQTTPDINGLDIASVSIPAYEVGGDYFDFLNGFDDGLMIIVGDVSGKGTSAALYMSKLQGIFRSLNAFNLSPKDMFLRANKILSVDLEKKSFVTAIGAQFELSERKIRLARAGHLPLYHYKAEDKKIISIIPDGLGLGLGNPDLFDEKLTEIEIDFKSGDIFVFLTDGLTEAYNSAGVEFGEDKLLSEIISRPELSAMQICDNLISSVRKFTGTDIQQDDITLVIVKINQN
ncbi:MAG: SpoIIE family protein phosphatase [Calditrichaceae bacterium]